MGIGFGNPTVQLERSAFYWSVFFKGVFGDVHEGPLDADDAGAGDTLVGGGEALVQALVGFLGLLEDEGALVGAEGDIFATVQVEGFAVFLPVETVNANRFDENVNYFVSVFNELR